METPYSKAWKKFIRSKEAIGLLSRMGSASVYSENKLRVAFDAGWNAREDNAPSLCHEHELPCDDDGECVQCHEMKWLR